MTDSSYSHILAIVDRSGSMAWAAEDMRGGLDSFFAEQAKLEGKALVDYVQFDSEYEKVFEDVPAGEAKAVLNPRGSTALLDAVGKAVTDLGEKLAAKKEGQRPGRVIVVVVTDGYENASTEWNKKSVAELIKQQEDKYDWDFTFLGANMDAVAVGQSFGFKADKSLTYDAYNTSAMSASLNNYVTQSRLVGNAASYTQEDREANA